MSAVEVPVKKESFLHRWTNNIIAIVFALGFAYFVWNGIDYAIKLNESRTLNATQWVAVILAIVLPVLIAVLAYTFMRRGSIISFLFVQLAGLALSAAYWLNVVGYIGLHESIAT